MPRNRRSRAARRVTATILTVLLITGLVGAMRVGQMAGAADRSGMKSIATRLSLPAWVGVSDGEQSTANALHDVDVSLERAAATVDPASAPQELALVEAAIARAIAAGVDPGAIADRRSILAALRGRLDPRLRLIAPERLVALPVPAEASAHLILDERDIVVATNELYRYSANHGELTTLFRQNQEVDSVTSGALRGVAQDDESLVLTDGRSLFSSDGDDAWSGRELPPAATSSAWPVAPCGAFDGNFYLLDADAGRILKFGGDRSATPRDWAAGQYSTELRLGRDMIIDGRIHVLLADGRVLSFLRGQLEKTYAIPETITVDDPVAFAAGTGGRYFYVLDRGDGAGPGRIIRIDRESKAAMELTFDPASAASNQSDLFTQSRDIAVDDDQGIVYLLTDDALWRGELGNTTS